MPGYQKELKPNTLQGELELLLHTQVLDYSAEWMAGYDVAQHEGEESENPHNQQQNKEAYQAWQQGWWAGFYNEAPIYDRAAPVDTLASVQTAAANDQPKKKKRGDSGVEKVLWGVGVAFACVICYEMIATIAA